ncbi:Mlp family lipoprotein [Borrelia turicatae]|uniref:Mlp-type protein n=1 Tax=Borrelia turicatae (strain 91E135) TaxID=314724 RepID=A0ABF7R097_BORT9|nr:Mlp family lipoprotein [Borrelia turicatae]ASJ27751.1 Mlp-type protein [Borrelia turicatae 91E135]UPA14353.1 Mlp family lipoprotein [Borrelia turicatae 91E135]
MNKINFILVLLLLISSCEYEHGNATPKSRVKRNLEEQSEVQKTPEEALREKLNDTEKTNLDFLKEALGNESKFSQFLSFDEEKIKAALKHINDELAKCNGNNEGKNGFKAVVQGYFSKIDNDTLNGFKENATSTCQAGGSG